MTLPIGHEPAARLGASCSTAARGSTRTRSRTSATTSRTRSTSTSTARAMVSGPIRRNKTFFMGGYQGFYENIPFPVTRTVPTEAQLRGDFSQTTTANGTPILIYDPATTTCNANLSSCTRQPFPGNIIPQNRWHPIAQALLPHIPTAERHAQQPVGHEQLHQLAEPRALSLQLVSDAHRPRLQRLAPDLGQQQRRTGASSIATRTRCLSRRSAATTTRRTANHYLLTVDDNATLSPTTVWNTRGLLGSLRRAARQGVRQHRPAICRSPGPTS